MGNDREVPKQEVMRTLAMTGFCGVPTKHCLGVHLFTLIPIKSLVMKISS